MPVSTLYVNLPVRYAVDNARYLDYFLEHGLNPELGLDFFALEHIPAKTHAAIARKLNEAGLRCSVHLPFHDLHPGAGDVLILAATRERLRRGLELAQVYQPDHMIGHALYADMLYNGRYEQWLETSVQTWSGLLELWPDHPPLYLENVYETSPASLAALLDSLQDLNTGACFDLGHWHSFGAGAKKNNLSFWIKTLAPYLKHLHLHDNTGEGDAHLGLGEGAIPLDELFMMLESLRLTPTATLEPHTEEDLLASLYWVFNHSERFIKS